MRQRVRPLAAAVGSALLVLAQPAAHAEPAAPAAPGFSYYGGGSVPGSQQKRILLVVPILNGRELNDNLALWREPDGADFVNLDAFLHASAIDSTKDADGNYQLTTPIGQTLLPAASLRTDGGVVYAGLQTLSSVLAARVAFDDAEFALRIDLPWQPGAADKSPATGDADQSVDVRAPQASLSRWRSELSGTVVDGEAAAYMNHRIAGALGPGYWHADFSHGVSGDSHDVDVQALSWLLDRGKSRWLVGQERLALHPLLASFEMTGVQYAQTNRPDLVYEAAGGYYGQLVPYQARPTSVIRGSGPPGGTAELRYGGQVLQRQTIRLDGRYEFRDVPAAPGDAIPIEVAVYAFGETGTPLRVDQTYSQAGNLQLPEGVNVHYVGLGSNGFLLDDNRSGTGGAGFYQFRRGFTDRVTAEAIVQSIGGRRQTVAGTALNLGMAGSWAAYAGRDDSGAGARQVLGDGQYGPWFWRANWLDYDDDYQADGSLGTRNRRAEAGRTFGDQLRVSLIHSDISGDAYGDIRYTKPAVTWRPTPRFSLGARPEYDGRYSYDAQWAVRRGTRLSASRYADISQVALDQDLGSRSRLQFTAQRDTELGNRYTATFNRYEGGRAHLAWAAGVLGGEGRTGFLAEASAELRPGLSARLTALRDPLHASDGTVIGFSIVADFAVTGAGLARGGVNQGYEREGGVSGIVERPAGARADFDLSGIPVLVDGHVRTRTEEGGHYHVQNLDPGVHRVELDNEGLPIELAVHEAPRRVEVRAGSLTRVDFGLELRLGLAGQVRGADGKPAVDIDVLVVDATGAIRARARSNTNGYYRLDGLPPGTYALRAVDRLERTLVETSLTLGERFLFGRELVLPADPNRSSPP
jgi:hypothetical protein